MQLGLQFASINGEDAIDNPIPDAAPVMKATLFLKESISIDVISSAKFSKICCEFRAAWWEEVGQVEHPRASQRDCCFAYFCCS